MLELKVISEVEPKLKASKNRGNPYLVFSGSNLRAIGRDALTTKV